MPWAGWGCCCTTPGREGLSRSDWEERRLERAGRDRVRGSNPTGEPRDSAKRETMQTQRGAGPKDVETG